MKLPQVRLARTSTPWSTSRRGMTPLRFSSSLSQKPGSTGIRFPGAVSSQFVNSLSFEHPSTYPALPTYRCVNQDGDIVDDAYKPEPDSLALKMYQDMLAVSIMDVIMFDAQRQGRLSFYMTSQGEEGTCVGSASALEKEDVIFCQYREAGVFMERGYTFDDFMNQLFANVKDAGRGRNMPVHYGSKALNIVCTSARLRKSTIHGLPSNCN